MYDLNDAQPQMAPIGELIPDGTFAKVRMTIRPGGVNGSTPMDVGLLKASQIERRQDARLRVHSGRGAVRPAQVLAELHRRRAASSTRRVSRRAGTSPRAPSAPWSTARSGSIRKDKSAAAKQKRVIQGLKQLDGIVFVARIMVEPASSPQYKDANKLANVVLPGEPQYAAVMRGESVQPDPVNAKPRKAADTPAAQTPAWSRVRSAPQPPVAGGVPWAAQSASNAGASGAAAAGPAWLNG